MLASLLFPRRKVRTTKKSRCFHDDIGFVWSDRTMTRLEQTKVGKLLEDRQLKLVCNMLELMYSLMIDPRDAIVNGVLFKQFVGPTKSC